MSRILSSAAFAVLLLILSFMLVSHDANAAILPGIKCVKTDLGRTTMDDNKENIVACVCADSLGTGCNPNVAGNLKWKSMSPDNFTCPSGYVANALTNGRIKCNVKTVTLSQACTSPQVMNGIDANGKILCTTVSSSSSSTPTGPTTPSGLYRCPKIAAVGIFSSECQGQTQGVDHCSAPGRPSGEWAKVNYACTKL